MHANNVYGGPYNFRDNGIVDGAREFAIKNGMEYEGIYHVFTEILFSI